MNIFKNIQPRTLIYYCLGIITCVFVFNYIQIFDFKPDLNGDNVYYYSLGKALASGQGYTNIMFLEESPHSHFPRVTRYSRHSSCCFSNPTRL